MSIIIENDDMAARARRQPAGLFITDLDGTLLRSDRTFSAGDLASLRSLGDHHVVRVVATGRSMNSRDGFTAHRLPRVGRMSSAPYPPMHFLS